MPSAQSSLHLQPAFFLLFLVLIHRRGPRVLEHSLYPNPALHIAVQHLADQINTVLAHHVRHAQVMVHDLINTIKRVLLVHDSVKKDAQGPDVLLFAAVWQAAEDFGRGVVCHSQHL